LALCGAPKALSKIGVVRWHFVLLKGKLYAAAASMKALIYHHSTNVEGESTSTQPTRPGKFGGCSRQGDHDPASGGLALLGD